jgi:putative membrane protein
MIRRALLIVLGAIVLAGMGWTFVSPWADIVTVGQGVVNALWTLPLLIGVHLTQLFLSGVAWWSVFAAPRPAIVTCFRLRLIREGIDSLFPVAQVGGEVIAARMLAKTGIEAARAGASVIVDVSLEVLAQAIFLLAGVGTLAVLVGGQRWTEWLGSLALVAFGAGGFLLAQRFGLLRLLEMLTDRIGARFPDLANLSLAGVHAAAAALYSRRCAVFRGFLFHVVSWSLGSIESWLVLHALGLPASLPQAFVVESLGMAARTAGFAIPGALAVQEGGFALAAMSVGLPESAGLALSLVKRAREVLVGAAGVTLACRERGFQ